MWQSCYGERRSSRQGRYADAGKPLRVERIDCFEIVDVGEQQGHLDDVSSRAPARIQNRIDIHECLKSLCLKTFLELARFRISTSLRRYKDEIARAYSL